MKVAREKESERQREAKRESKRERDWGREIKRKTERKKERDREWEWKKKGATHTFLSNILLSFKQWNNTTRKKGKKKRLGGRKGLEIEIVGTYRDKKSVYAQLVDTRV